MRLLEYKREEIIQGVSAGLMKRKTLMNFDICVEIKKGNTQERISEKFDITPRRVRKIKHENCPDCGLLPGYRILTSK